MPTEDAADYQKDSCPWKLLEECARLAGVGQSSIRWAVGRHSRNQDDHNSKEKEVLVLATDVEGQTQVLLQRSHLP